MKSSLRLLLIASVAVFSLILISCGKDKNAMLGAACSLVAAAEEVSRKIRVETPRPTYQEREDAWESASIAFDELAESFPEYLQFAVIVKNIYIDYKETWADGPSASEVRKVSGLCGVNIVW